MIVFENKYTEMDESESCEKKKLDIRCRIGGFGVKKEQVMELFADISDKAMEIMLTNEDTTLEQEIQNIGTSYGCSEKKGVISYGK